MLHLRIFRLFILPCLLCVIFLNIGVSCGEDFKDTGDFNIYLFKGQKYTLIPSGNSASDYTFTSDNSQVARADKKGIVTALKTGTAEIICESGDKTEQETFTVHVVENVKKIKMSSSKLSLSLPEVKGNSTGQLSVQIDPADAWIQTGVWSSSNESIAVVDQEGNVTAEGTGTAVITFLSDDNSKGAKKAACNVTVVQGVTDVVLSETSGVVYAGKTVRLKATVEPSKAVHKKVTWSSSNEKVATVDKNGQVKGVAPGKVTITATSEDGPSASWQGEVRIAPVTLKISVKAKCIAKNHVGNSWGKAFYLNGSEFKGTAKLKVSNGDTFEIGCVIWENDKYPDEGGFAYDVDVTPEMMTKGATIEEMVYVTENGGRYSGNTAEWKVVFTIKP